MKKWLPLLWIILTVLVIAAGAFLPGYILTNTATPEYNLDYNIITVSAQDTTDYYWRLLRYADCISPYSSQESELTIASAETYYSESELDEMLDQCLEEAETLEEYGILSRSMITSLRASEKSFSVNYYFDSGTTRSFQVGIMAAVDDSRGISIYLWEDISSGKIWGISVLGAGKRQIENAYASFSSWADLLRVYADYLGLETETETEPLADVGDFFITNTVQMLTYTVPDEKDTITLHVAKTDSFFYITP